MFCLTTILLSHLYGSYPKASLDSTPFQGTIILGIMLYSCIYLYLRNVNLPYSSYIFFTICIDISITILLYYFNSNNYEELKKESGLETDQVDSSSDSNSEKEEVSTDGDGEEDDEGEDKKDDYDNLEEDDDNILDEKE
jgi:hypothetical protein